MSKTGKNFALGAVFAAVAGYIAGILTAPKSGKETREDIKNVAEQTIGEVEDKLKAAHSELNILLDKAKAKTGDLKGQAQKELNGATTLAEKAKEKVRMAISSVHEGESSDKDLQKALTEAEKSIEHLKKFISK